MLQGGQPVFEAPLVNYVFRMMQEDERMVLIDIGANLGVYTLPVAHLRSNAPQTAGGSVIFSLHTD